MRNQEYKIDIGVGVVSFLIGLAAMLFSIGMPGRASMFPRVVAVLFMIIGLCLMAVSILRISHKEESKKEELTFDLFRGPLVVLFMLLVYVVAMPKVGFYVTTLAMLIVYMRVLGIRSWKTILIVTVIVMLFIFGLFTLGLNIPLPTGILR